MNRLLRLGLIAAIAVATLLVIDTVAWWLVTSRMQSEAAAWQQARIAAGYEVTAGAPVRAGWPLRAEVILPAVGIATGTSGSPDRVAWQAGEARLVYAPWSPAQVTLVIDGPQTIQFGTHPAIAVGVQSLGVVVPLNAAGQADGVVVVARQLQCPLPNGTAGIDSLWVKLSAAELHISLSAITLPGKALPFGLTIGSVDLHARSTIPLSPVQDPAAAAAAWRDSGGQLVISEFALGWGPLDVHGTAMLSLDRALQPVGNGTIRMTGYTPATEALVRDGMITRNDARVARTLLGLLSHTGEDGVPQADLPFSLRDGLLSTGAIPLIKLPPLALP
jgi:hypothetical protein